MHLNLHTYEGYPKVPPYTPDPGEGLKWYYDQVRGFGCWVLSNYQKPMLVPRSVEEAKRDPSIPKRYKSPVPLHEPIFPPVYRGSIVWYVDEDGFGEAMYLKRQENGNLKLYRINEF